MRADEGTRHVSGLGPVQLVLNIKGERVTWWCRPKVCMKREHNFLNFFPSFFFGSVAPILSFLIILAEADANTWNGIKSLL